MVINEKNPNFCIDEITDTFEETIMLANISSSFTIGLNKLPRANKEKLAFED